MKSEGYSVGVVLASIRPSGTISYILGKNDKYHGQSIYHNVSQNRLFSLYLNMCIMGQVWYLIVSIPDLCPLSYFYYSAKSIMAVCVINFTFLLSYYI